MHFMLWFKSGRLWKHKFLNKKRRYDNCENIEKGGVMGYFVLILNLFSKLKKCFDP